MILTRGIICASILISKCTLSIVLCKALYKGGIKVIASSKHCMSPVTTCIGTRISNTKEIAIEQIVATTNCSYVATASTVTSSATSSPVHVPTNAVIVGTDP